MPKHDNHYTVDRVPSVNEQIRELVAKASAFGIRQAVLDALNAIVDELGTRPLEWGDPEYRTLKEGGWSCHGIRVPLIAHYVVFEAERVVMILKIKSLPGYGLE